MLRMLIFAQVTLLAMTTVLHAQTAKVLEVESASVALLKSNPPQLLVAAKGFVSDTGWTNARLIPYVYVVPPADGIWDFDFVADRVPGIHIQVLTPVFDIDTIPNPPDWVKGVRIHSSTNSVVAKLGAPFRIDTATKRDLAAADISLKIKYESSGSQHCVVATAEVKLGPINKTFELGRFCISVSGSCVSGTKDLGGGVKLEWRLCLEDGGRKLCFYGKVCKDFGFPIGNLCTPEGSACVGIGEK